jgi:hypothetical protein
MFILKIKELILSLKESSIKVTNSFFASATFLFNATSVNGLVLSIMMFRFMFFIDDFDQSHETTVISGIGTTTIIIDLNITCFLFIVIFFPLYFNFYYSIIMLSIASFISLNLVCILVTSISLNLARVPQGPA